MKYKVVASRPPKLDRWGHYLPDQPEDEVQYFDNYNEAKVLASKTSKEHKKWTVSVYDTQGPKCEEDVSRLWLVTSFEKGEEYTNIHYNFAKIYSIQ